MSLKAFVSPDELAELGEGFKSHYVESDGGFVLQVDGVNGLELVNASGLKSSLEKERKFLKEAKEQLKQFDGLDPKQSREALEKLEEFGNFDPEQKLAAAKAQWEQGKVKEFNALKTQLVSELDDKVTAANTRHAAIRSQLEGSMVEQQALAAIRKAGGVKVKQLLYPCKEVAKLVDNDDGTVSVRIFNHDGTERMVSRNGEIVHATFDDVVGALKQSDDWGNCFEGSGQSGGGTSGGGSSGHSGVTGGAGGKLFLSDADARDPQKYRAAVQQAEDQGKQLVLTDTE